MTYRRVLPLVLLVCTPLQAAVYKCTDAQGVTQYSDAPCGDNASVIVPDTAPPPAADAAQRLDKTQRLLRAYEVENAERQRAAAAARAAEAEAEQNCIAARERLRDVTRARALYRLDEEGNRVALSFDARAAAEQQAGAAVAHWCK
jgi:hypothetical protein